MNENTEIIKIFDECIHTIELSKSFISQIVFLKNKIIKCLESENKIVIFGNGGSASDAQHFAAELIGRFRIERKSLPAIALTTDTSIITAIGNDYGFDHVFERQKMLLHLPCFNLTIVMMLSFFITIYYSNCFSQQIVKKICMQYDDLHSYMLTTLVITCNRWAKNSV